MNQEDTMPRKIPDLVTAQNLVASQDDLIKLIWEGNYREALPLADSILLYKRSVGEEREALVPHASTYYSAATNLFTKRSNPLLIASHMRTALVALQSRLSPEQGVRNKKTGLLVKLDPTLSADELDVIQSIYRKTSIMAQRIPKMNSFRRYVESWFPRAKHMDPIRSFDAAALIAIRNGLRKDTLTMMPHTKIFLLYGAFEILVANKKEGLANVISRRIFDSISNYPWPETTSDKPLTPNQLTIYGQAARVARYVRDVAKRLHRQRDFDTFNTYAEQYTALVPDQKLKNK